jgi:homoserine dehydrogenase
MKDKARDFDDVLKEAQALGYAEADPTFDVEGIDAAHKLAILSSVAFGAPLQFSKTFTEGISNVAPEDIRNAEDLGYRIKHLGITKRQSNGIELRVHPTLIPESQLIAKVDGVMNAVLIESDAVGQTMYYGPGAGSEATASAVIADIVDIARALKAGVAPSVPPLGFSMDKMKEIPVLDIKECVSAFYLRISAEDHPGVLAEVSSIMSRHCINIESVLQKESARIGELIPLVMLTHEVQEAKIDEALKEIEMLESVSGSVKKIRVAQFAQAK